jgi:ATP-dependent Lon protease
MSTDTEFIRILGAASDQEAAESPTARPPPKALPEILPILGLADIVIFPGMVAPLLVDTAQSIRLIDDVVEGDRLLGLVLQKKPDVNNPLPEDLYDYGCGARVLKMLKFPDNTVRVLVEGLWRIRIKDYESHNPYLKARIEVMKDVTADSVEYTALLRNAHRQFQEIIKLNPALPDQVKIAALNAEATGNLTDLISANLNLSLEERQHLLEQVDVKERLHRLQPLLNRELEVATLTSKIQNDVASTMAKSQRDFFLREQIRAIQKELGEGDPIATEINNLREQIEKKKLPEDVQKAAIKELERLGQMSPAVAEYTIARTYLDWILALPWNQSSKDAIEIDEAARILNDQHFGLEKVKERLLDYIAVIKLKNDLKGPLLCLVGPPGVGKTSLGKSVADALGRKFARMALGGLRDEAEIRGHRRTYVGAMPGRIIQILRRVETKNPVILLDEIDKVGSDFRGDPSSALLEVLDPQQNFTFTDHYLDLPFDLSQVLFITTANWLDPIQAALRDRLEVINLPSYTLSEKLQIARRFLVPRQLEEHGLPRKRVRFPDSTLRKLVSEYTHEAGVRQLEREIGTITRKAVRKILAYDGQAQPIKVPPASLVEYLGQPKFVSESAEKITEYGIALGLAWTPVGGEILFIEATRMPGSGRLTLTGSLGDVMKESAQTALSYLRSQASVLNLKFTEFDKFDVHVHVPAGATPKDGPSAGSTIVVALASLFTHRLVRSEVAMTGEISLRGRILRVGGIKEKVLAATRSGVKEVILPEQNRNDWMEIPDEVRKKMKVHFVSHISDLIKTALRPK